MGIESEAGEGSRSAELRKGGGVLGSGGVRWAR